MPGVVRTPPRLRVPRVALNVNVRRPRLALNVRARLTPLTALAWFTLAIGVASFVLGVYIREVPSPPYPDVLAATVTGIASLAVGLYAQMVSATRAQRMLIVTGMVLGFVGMALGVALGGLS